MKLPSSRYRWAAMSEWRWFMLMVVEDGIIIAAALGLIVALLGAAS